MAAGYIFITIFFFIVTLVVSLAAYRYYTKVSIKRMPLMCSFWHVVSLYVCVIPFPLLVVDVDAALSSRESDAKQNWMKPIWVTIFAFTYFCAWISLPVAQLYTEVGNFTWKGALLKSIKKNTILYLVLLVIVGSFFAYLLVLKGAYTSWGDVAKVGISLANAWGLLILVLFMGAGLIGVPKMLWRYSDARRLLRRHLYDAVSIQEDLDLAAMDLAEVKAELMALDPIVEQDHRKHLAYMLELISQADSEIPLYHIAATRVKLRNAPEHTDVSLLHLESLHERLRYSIKVATRMNYRWYSTVRKCDAYDKIIRGVKETNNPVKKYWFTMREYVYKAGCCCASLLTITILWSEIVLPFRSLTDSPLSVIEILMRGNAHFLASVVILFYMAYCAYWAIFQFKVFDVYVIYPSIADNASLCFNETFLVRLLMPLCFNFLLISGLSVNSGVDVMYGHVYRRNMDVSLLFGEWFNRFLPMAIPLVSLIVFARLTQRLLALAGVEVHNPNDIDSPEVRQRLEDGKRLVEGELGYQLVSFTAPGTDATAGDNSIDGNGRNQDSFNKGKGELEKGRRYREYLASRNTGKDKDKNEGSNKIDRLV